MPPPKELKCERPLSHHSEDSRFSVHERIIFILSSLMIITMLIIAAWSGILLLAGSVEGGGPLGMIMNALPIHLLLEE